jgi:hypothetical protein
MRQSKYTGPEGPKEAEMAEPTAIPQSTLNAELTTTQLQGCAFCGFDNYDPHTETLNAIDACPTCARQLGFVEVKVCPVCGELYPTDDECHCYRATPRYEWSAA